MFIKVVYKATPDLTTKPIYLEEKDPSEEQILLVNPVCNVGVFLEYIRNSCKLGVFAQFDLAEENGRLKELNNIPAHAHADDKFEHKKTYYIIVFKKESEHKTSIIPQLNRDNRLFLEIKSKVSKFLSSKGSTEDSTSSGKSTPFEKNAPSGKKR